MPFVRAADGTRLYFEETGGDADAPVVLLVMGAGLRGAIWGETRDVLAGAGYRTVTMDNRGVGESEMARGKYTTVTMADDAIAVLNAVAVLRAHVVGTSLGGMVAQQIAFKHARRLRALVLQSTTAGLPRIDFLPPLAPLRWAALYRARLLHQPPARRARAALRLATTRTFARDADLEDPRVRLYLDELEAGISPAAHLAQVRAATDHRGWRRLHTIRAPTLIQHGAQDRVVRAAAARAMAARIPGAQLEIYARAGHFLALQRPDSLQRLLAFLQAHDARSASAPPGVASSA